ncbi:MAG: rhodanese-like domain-containing protein [Limisphaerales bacterium]
MNWRIVLVIGVVMALIIGLKRLGLVSAKAAQAHLKIGALVIDVRSRGEFNSGHLPTAINIPLDEIATALPRRVKDKNQTLLLHCLSGTRSGMAKGKIKSLGYANVFNLGSFGRARKIVGQSGGN